MTQTTHTLANGVRVLHLATDRPVSWVGVAIDAGTRDELPDESGMAHFVEHMLFKGTENRKSYHIISRLENVGGQLDAYTTKEETYLYATVPRQYTERAIELLSDLTLHSIFPDNEIELEREVVLDEIQSYNDSPAELIYDEFEQQLFPTDPIGRNILGTERSLNSFNTNRMMRYVKRNFTPDRMVVFYMGSDKASHLFRRVERHFGEAEGVCQTDRKEPSSYVPSSKTCSRDTFQAHCIIGNRCCSMSAEERLKTVLVNNILGGPSMVSKLNLAVRERNGLCYTIESNTSFYTDTGVWNIYFGCDPDNLKRVYRLCQQQMEILASKPMTDKQLDQAKLQLRGQVLISNENFENIILSTSKSYLHHLPLTTDEEQLEIIEAFTVKDILTQAQQLFNPTQLSTLIFTDNATKK